MLRLAPIEQAGAVTEPTYRASLFNSVQEPLQDRDLTPVSAQPEMLDHTTPAVAHESNDQEKSARSSSSEPADTGAESEADEQSSDIRRDEEDSMPRREDMKLNLSQVSPCYFYCMVTQIMVRSHEEK